MSERTFIPDRGDLIEVNFYPAAGREIDKRRPAIVLSAALTTGKLDYVLPFRLRRI